MNSSKTTRRAFLVRASTLAAGVGPASALVGCGRGRDRDRDDDSAGSAKTPARFAYGVASGDPLADRVILWTHARRDDSPDDVALTWQVAADSGFASVVASGSVTASQSSGFTAKADAGGLRPGASYYYRFFDDAGNASPTGVTRTLPSPSEGSVKLAVFSCAHYSAGFFNAFAEATRRGAQYAIFLGDYVYEYGADPAEFGNADAAQIGRIAVPATDCVTLDDYRSRYALHRSDPVLQEAHRQIPWIAVWDDHEFADNSWPGGAANHDPATQGDWGARRTAAARAFHEWLPIRSPDPQNLFRIYRRFDFGSLFTLHMIDTRMEGRDRQYSNYGDADGGLARYQAGVTPGAGGVSPDAARRMISDAQQAWLLEGIAASGAPWQLIGNQDLMARMWIPASVLTAQAKAAADPSSGNVAALLAQVGSYLTAKATLALGGDSALSSSQRALLDPVANPRLPFNLDAWDGYPAQRDTILKAIRTANRRLVVLSGDSHDGWFTNLTTLAGDKAGVEFGCTSVSSPGLDSVGLSGLASSLDGSVLGGSAEGKGLGLIDDLVYADTARRGYVSLTVTAAAVTGEYVFVDTVKSQTYGATVGRTVTVSGDGGTVLA